MLWGDISYQLMISNIHFTFCLICVFFFTEKVYSFSALDDSWIELTTVREADMLNQSTVTYLHSCNFGALKWQKPEEVARYNSQAL